MEKGIAIGEETDTVEEAVRREGWKIVQKRETQYDDLLARDEKGRLWRVSEANGPFALSADDYRELE
jgi:hypothetical protein